MLFVARFHPMASGVEVIAYDTEHARERWRRFLYGAGPITHSRYRNEVQLRVVDGRLHVLGWETAERYLEVLDAASGQTVGYRAFGMP